MLADPLPFLSHILYSAAPSVSALPVLFFCAQLVHALILTPLCPSVRCICKQHLTSTRQLIFVFKRRSDTCVTSSYYSVNESTEKKPHEHIFEVEIETFD